MNDNRKKTFVFFYGNTLREDDGIGYCLYEAFLEEGFAQTALYYSLQLLPEAAELFCEFDAIVFVDAAMGDEVGRVMTKTLEKSGEETIHELSPEGLVQLSKELFGFRGSGYIFTVQSDRFAYKEELSMPMCERFPAIKRALATFISTL